MSRAMRPITCFVSRVEWISACISCSVLLVLLCLRKPFWRGSSRLFFPRNHLSLESMIFSNTLTMVLRSDIGLYDLVSNLFLFGLGIGMTIECFHFLGIAPDDHILLNTMTIESRAEMGRLWMKQYGIPSGPGARLVHFDVALTISASWIGELSFDCSSRLGLMQDV